MLIKKLITKDCGCTIENYKDVLPDPKCKSCKGTGILEDSIYYIVNEKNKISFDADTPGK